MPALFQRTRPSALGLSLHIPELTDHAPPPSYPLTPPPSGRGCFGAVSPGGLCTTKVLRKPSIARKHRVAVLRAEPLSNLSAQELSDVAAYLSAESRGALEDTLRASADAEAFWAREGDRKVRRKLYSALDLEVRSVLNTVTLEALRFAVNSVRPRRLKKATKRSEAKEEILGDWRSCRTFADLELVLSTVDLARRIHVSCRRNASDRQRARRLVRDTSGKFSKDAVAEAALP